MRPRMFNWALQCWFHQFGKVPNFVVGEVLCRLTLQATIVFGYSLYMFILICLLYLRASFFGGGGGGVLLPPFMKFYKQRCK